MRLRLRSRRGIAVLGVVAVIATSAGVASAAAIAGNNNRATLKFSVASDRSNLASLGNANVQGNIYVVVSGSTSRMTKADFRLDDPLGTGPVLLSEAATPLDFAGGAADGSAKPFDTSKLTEGRHSILAEVTFADGTIKDAYARFTVGKATAGTPAPTTTTAPPVKVTTTSVVNTPTTAKPTTTTAAPTTTTTSPVGSVPTPTPTPSGDKPSAANTGVPAGTALKVVNGDQTYSTDGQVIDGLDIHGRVWVTGSNITIKNSIIRGTASTVCNNNAVLQTQGKATTVSHVEIAPTNATACMDGIWAADVVLDHVNIHGTVDGVKAFDNTTLQNSFVHDLAFFNSDPNQGGGETHNDAVQTYEANSNIKMLGNVLDAGKNGNAAYQLTDDAKKPAANILIQNNWLSGGGCTLNLADKYGTSMTGLVVSGNRFTHTQAFEGCVIKMSKEIGISISGNVWDDTGAAVPGPQYF